MARSAKLAMWWNNTPVIAGQELARTPMLYDRTSDQIILDEIERIPI